MFPNLSPIVSIEKPGTNIDTRKHPAVTNTMEIKAPGNFLDMRGAPITIASDTSPTIAVVQSI
jgi:hypothetical protein